MYGARRTTLATATAALLGCAIGAAPGAAQAGSVAFQTVPFGRAVTMSARVVKGEVTSRSEIKVDGGTFHFVEIAVDAALKGTPAKAGERVRVFDGAEWFQHTHAAAIKGGVVSYADPRYATPLPAAELKPGAAVLVFLRGEAPPPGFPANAAFLSAGGAFERAERAPDVARMKAAAFGDPITIALGEVAVLPDGLELEVKGHTHKRPMTGGPRKEMAEVEARMGGRKELVVVGHVVEPGTPPKETWETRTWGQYDLSLLGMKHGTETTMRVVRRP
jgi:hypothetical protein